MRHKGTEKIMLMQNYERWTLFDVKMCIIIILAKHLYSGITYLMTLRFFVCLFYSEGNSISMILTIKCSSTSVEHLLSKPSLHLVIKLIIPPKTSIFFQNLNWCPKIGLKKRLVSFEADFFFFFNFQTIFKVQQFSSAKITLIPEFPF